MPEPSQRVHDIVSSLLRNDEDQWETTRQQLITMGASIAPMLLDEIRKYRTAYRQFQAEDKVFTSVPRTDEEFEKQEEKRRRLSHVPGFIAEGVLGRLGPAAAPCLIAVFHEDDLHFEIEKALRGIGKPVCQLVMRFLSDPKPRVRKSALRVLEWLEEDAFEAAPGIILLFKDTDPEIREEATVALARIIGPASLSHLTPLLNDEVSRVRRSVLEAISWIACTLRDSDRYKTMSLEDFTESVMPALLIGLSDKNGSTSAANALIYLAQTVNAKRSIKPLIAALQFNPQNDCVCRALAAMMPDPIPQLLNAFDHPNPKIREGAESVFWYSTWAESTVNVPPLVSPYLRSKVPHERIQATKALKAMRTSSKKELPELKRLLHDSDRSVASAAREAIKDIEK